MFRFLAMISVVLAFAVPVRADIEDTLARYRAEINTMTALQEARWSFGSASRATLQAAFETGGVVWAQRYLDSWSDWLWIDWSATSELYALAERRLNEWSYAVESGKADAAEVESMLAGGMVRLRMLYSRIQFWFTDDLEYTVERALLLDRANEASECCGDLYNYYMEMAEKSKDDSISPDYRMIGAIKVFPAVPEGGGVPSLPQPDLSALELRASEDFANGDRMVIRRNIRDAEVLLARAAALSDGQLRDAILLEARDGLLDRLGHLSEMLAGPATGMEDRESLRSLLLVNAKRLAQLADDSRLEFQRASGDSRLFAGLSAASNALDVGESGSINGSELAQSAAQELKEVLAPKRFVRSLTRRFVEGVVNNVPFARSLYDWVIG